MTIESLVGASTYWHPTASDAMPPESDDQKPLTLGDGCHGYCVWTGWLGQLTAAIDGHECVIAGYESAF